MLDSLQCLGLPQNMGPSYRVDLESESLLLLGPARDWPRLRAHCRLPWSTIHHPQSPLVVWHLQIAAWHLQRVFDQDPLQSSVLLGLVSLVPL